MTSRAHYARRSMSALNARRLPRPRWRCALRDKNQDVTVFEEMAPKTTAAKTTAVKAATRNAPTRRTVFKKALSLPPKERAALAHELIASLDDGEAEDPKEVEKAWAKEIERRIADVDSGSVTPVPWEEARARIQQNLKKVRANRAPSESRSRS